jgi:hypothetical protein
MSCPEVLISHMLAVTTRIHLESVFTQLTGFLPLHQSLRWHEQANRQHPPATASIES